MTKEVSQCILSPSNTISSSDGGLTILHIRRRDGGREGEVVLYRGGDAAAAKVVLRDLDPLGDSPCRSLADRARVCQKYCPRRNLKASSLGIIAMPPKKKTSWRCGSGR
jgi:hypothetical protein